MRYHFSGAWQPLPCTSGSVGQPVPTTRHLVYRKEVVSHINSSVTSGCSLLLCSSLHLGQVLSRNVKTCSLRAATMGEHSIDRDRKEEGKTRFYPLQRTT